MIKMTFSIKTLPNKELEFALAMESLIKEFRKEAGSLSYQIRKQDKLQYGLESEWQSMEALENHFRGHLFSILLGAFLVLCEPPEVEISDGENSFGMEFIEAIRSS